MILVEGKQVFTTIDELVRPDHTALLVIDMQNDCCMAGGAFGRVGADLSMYEEMIPRLARLIEEARRANVLIIYVQATTLPGRLSESPAQIRFDMRLHKSYASGADTPMAFTKLGTWGHEIVEPLAPHPGDPVVLKHRSSAFAGTNLDLLLRSNGTKTVVVTGCTTEGCVDSTIREAGFNDYYVVAVRDCVATDNKKLHEAAMRVLEAYRCDVEDSMEIIRVWREGSRS